MALVLLLSAGLVQAIIVPRLSPLGLNADLVLLIVLAWGLLRGPHEGLVWGLLGGLSLDLLSVVPFGANALALVLVGYGLGLSSRGGLHPPTLLVALASVPLATLAYDVVLMAVLQAAGWPIDWGLALWQTVLPAAVLNSLFMGPIYGALRSAGRRWQPAIIWQG